MLQPEILTNRRLHLEFIIPNIHLNWLLLGWSALVGLSQWLRVNFCWVSSEVYSDWAWHSLQLILAFLLVVQARVRLIVTCCKHNTCGKSSQKTQYVQTIHWEN